MVTVVPPLLLFAVVVAVVACRRYCLVVVGQLWTRPTMTLDQPKEGTDKRQQ